MRPASIKIAVITFAGVNLNDYLQQLRMNKACELLEETWESFESMATEVGYGVRVHAVRRS